MNVTRAIIALLILGSLAGCISARVDARDASREWAGVAKSWAEAYKQQGQGGGERK